MNFFNDLQKTHLWYFKISVFPTYAKSTNFYNFNENYYSKIEILYVYSFNLYPLGFFLSKQEFYLLVWFLRLLRRLLYTQKGFKCQDGFLKLSVREIVTHTPWQPTSFKRVFDCTECTLDLCTSTTRTGFL